MERGLCSDLHCSSYISSLLPGFKFTFIFFIIFGGLVTVKHCGSLFLTVRVEACILRSKISLKQSIHLRKFGIVSTIK